MTDFHPWQSRPRRHRIDKGWIIAIAALVLLASLCMLATAAQGAGIPPRPGTRATLPAPVGRHEMRLYCRNFAQRPAMRIECRKIGGYR